MASVMKSLLEIVFPKQTENPELVVSNLDIYEFMRHADNGTGPFSDMTILTEHQRERYYAERRDYSYYLNFIGLAISRLVDPVYREDPERRFGEDNESTDPRLNLFMEDCNKRKQPFAHVIRQQSRKVKRYSMHFCVVDNSSEVAQTEQEAVENRQLPYIYWKSPETVFDYDVDEIGRLISITFTEDGKNEDGEVETRYRKWFIGGWELYRFHNEKKQTIELRETDLDILPVVAIYDVEPDADFSQVMVPPELYHLTRATVAMTNQSSEIREVQRNQGFSLMTYPITPGTDKSFIKDTVVGTKNAMPYDASSNKGPEFISPDADVTRAIIEDRDWIKNQVFKLARVVGLEQTKQQSGISKEWDFVATNEALGAFSRVMEQAESDILKIVYKYLQIQDFDYKVDYSENFGVVDTEKEVDLIERDLALDMPESFKTERRKQYTATRIPDKETREQVLSDIDNMAEDETQSEPLEDEE